MARNLRYSLRQLCRTPGFSLAAVLTLALGIGANVAVFGLVNLLLFQPLAGSGQPGQVVGVYMHDPATPGSYRGFSYAQFEDIRDHAGVFTRVMAHRSDRLVLSHGDASRQVHAARVTGSYFSTLGVRLLSGRTFTRDEERPGSGARVAVISHSLWQDLGGTPSVLGQTVLLNSHAFTVVGIAPPGFAGPMAAFGPLLWIPLGAGSVVAASTTSSPSPTADAAASYRASRDLLVVGRLAPGASIPAADAALRRLSSEFARLYPQEQAHDVLTAASLARTEQGTQPGDDSGLLAPLGILTGMAAVLLLVASLNVANMQLARGQGRRKEVAMRLALGAPRRRVVAQLLTEGLLLSLAGGAAGLLVGAWTLKLLVSSFAPIVDLSVNVPLVPDVRVLLATLAFSVLSAAIFALVPSWTLARLDLLPDLRGSVGDDRRGKGRARLGPRHLVVAGQLALSLALLSAAGLFVRAALAAGRADPGYALDGQLLARIDAAGYAEPQGREVIRAVRERLASTPGVASTSLASFVAFGNETSTSKVGRADAAARAADVVAVNNAIASGYFQTLGLRMLRGREFAPVEEQQPGPSRVAIIDEPLARSLFPAQDAVGQLIVFAAERGETPQPLQVIGVATGLRHRITDRAPRPHVYVPLGSRYQSRVNVHLRLSAAGRADIAGAGRRIRQAIAATDSRLAVLDISTLEEARDRSPLNWLVRTGARAFGALGFLAAGMAVIGLYGVKAYLVARRTRELGIRIALGATSGRVIGMILKEGSWLIAGGVLAGVLLALAAGQVVSGMLVGVRPFDPLVLSLATCVLALAVLAASYVPARRATRVDPAVALRTE